MTTRRQWIMALMAVGLVVGWVGTEAAAKGNPALNACNANLTTCNTSLGTCNGELATCDTDLGSCTTDLATCTADLGICNTDLPQAQADLSACTTQLAAAQKFPATGQTTSYTTGDDGDIEAGATLSYADNGNGTITDNNTGLMWEKKSDDSTINDKDTTYTWADAFTVHIAGLNAGGGFAGHTDWRLPNVKELQSIVNYENVNPAVSSEFNTGCAASCTVLTCSCTQASNYWSSSTNAFVFPPSAWVVHFLYGFVVIGDKSNDFFFVRAVRGGL